jgi:hypothetical protein
MRERIEIDEVLFKQDIFNFYEGGGRLPSKVNTFAAFREKKSNKVKDAAIKIVTKMYRLDRINKRGLAAGITSRFENAS